jgi:hypothetical protein
MRTMSRLFNSAFFVVFAVVVFFCCTTGCTAPGEASAREPHGLRLQSGYNHIPRRAALNCRSVRTYQRIGTATAQTQPPSTTNEDLVDAGDEDAEFQLHEVVIDSGCPEVVIDVRDTTPWMPDDGACLCSPRKSFLLCADNHLPFRPETLRSVSTCVECPTRVFVSLVGQRNRSKWGSGGDTPSFSSACRTSRCISPDTARSSADCNFRCPSSSSHVDARAHHPG